ncbi:hypothetical protein BT96DRAFT_388317 [Gymnopus androsaceus JB14]|uniref:SPX domain-containing protein n=1 Tax=Gymnopus androsaceus JB14 TaxID=1447944 RepID=A0A6A4I536_9AGAR|nr:hypothetical protein BT96DRAFT_388317 [Gymnopus androsaceus JB14]
MKFAKYLQQTQTPEWKRAYIDYRGLKKKIHKETTQEASESQSHLPTTLEPEQFPGQLANEGPSTSRMRHDVGMGIGELPNRRKSASTRKASSHSDLLPDTQHGSNQSRTMSGGNKPKSQSSKGFLARGALASPCLISWF